MELNQIYCMDALDFLKQLDRESANLVITSPPYNLRNTTGGGLFWSGTKIKWDGLKNGYDGYEDNMPRQEYIDWQIACLHEMYRILKPTGAIFYNHKSRVQAGLMESPNDIIKDFSVRQIIIWDRGSGFNWNRGYLVPSYELIYVIVKPDFKFNTKAFQYRDIWQVQFETKNEHPAAFPYEIPRRIIECVDTDLVVDPFMGSGTTALAAKFAGINYIGCDLSQEYVNLAKKRLQDSDPYQATELSNGQKQLSLFQDLED